MMLVVFEWLTDVSVTCVSRPILTWSNTWTIFVKAVLRHILALYKVWKAKLDKSMVH